MEISEKDITKAAFIILLIFLAILTFLVLEPIIFSIIGGLLLAYMFSPVHKKILKLVKNRTLSAILVSLFLIFLIVAPIWLLIPSLIQQVSEIFKISQTIDIQKFVSNVFPGASEQFKAQVVISANSAISKASAAILNYLVDFMINIPNYILHLVIISFVFFYALRDQDSLKEFASGLSPLNKNQEKGLVKQFKDITDSILYGQIVVGIYQGIATGIGLLIFGVPNPLLLTIIALIFSILPVIGPAIVYLPVTFYLLAYSNPYAAIIYLIYNLIVVSTVDNVLRAHLVARRTDLSQVFVIIGMVGGFLIFGVLGFVLGPLILAYFITFLRAYKDKTLSSLFDKEKTHQKNS